MEANYFYFVVAALVASATANDIKCYSCQSDLNPNCADPIKTGDNGLKADTCTSKSVEFIEKGLKGLSNLFGLEKSPEINFVCVKASYTNTTNGKEEHGVMRGCAIEGSRFCELIKEVGKKTNTNANVFCEECKTDECNGSFSMQATLAVLIPTMLLLWAMLN